MMTPTQAEAAQDAAATTMMRRDAWRAINVIAAHRTRTGRWPHLSQLLRGGPDLEPQALIWLDDIELVTAHTPIVSEPVSMWAVFNPPVPTLPGRYHRGNGHVTVRLTHVGQRWHAGNPYQKTLAAVHDTAGRLLLRRLTAREQLDLATFGPLANNGYIHLIDSSGIVLNADQTFTRADIDACTGRSTSEGRRLLAVT